MDMKAMDDDIGDVLYGNATPISNVDIDTTAIDGLEAVHDELLLKSDHHVPLEHYPQGFVLDDSVAQCARAGGYSIIVARVSHDIETTVTATNGIASKANTTVSEAFAIGLPIGVTAPTIINWVASTT